MNNHFSIGFIKSHLQVIICFILCLSSINVIAQKNKTLKPGYLEIFGNIKCDEKNCGNVKIVLFRDTFKLQELVTNASGKFDIRLELNQLYYMNVSKDGMITKVLTISTFVPDSSQLPYEYEYKFNVNLLENFSGFQNYEAFKKPAAKIIYNEKFNDFDADEEYTRELQAEMKLLQETIKLRIEEDNRMKIDSIIAAKKLTDSLAAIKYTQDSIAKIKNDSLAKVKVQVQFNKEFAKEDSIANAQKLKQQQIEQRKLDSAIKVQKPDTSSVVQNKQTTTIVQNKKPDIKNTTTTTDKKAPATNLPKFADKAYPEGITHETYNEKGMVIYRDVVKKSTQQDSYLKIVYDWGGVFYFRNEVELSSSSYQQELQNAREYFKGK